MTSSINSLVRVLLLASRPRSCSASTATFSVLNGAKIRGDEGVVRSVRERSRFNLSRFRKRVADEVVVVAALAALVEAVAAEEAAGEVEVDLEAEWRRQPALFHRHHLHRETTRRIPRGPSRTTTSRGRTDLRFV